MKVARVSTLKELGYSLYICLIFVNICELSISKFNISINKPKYFKNYTFNELLRIKML